jgi:hypothetical protein
MAGVGGRGSSLVTHASYESRRREFEIGDGLSRERTRERGARDRRERGGRILRRLRLCVLTTRSRSHQRQRACATRAGRLFFTPKRLLDGLSRHNKLISLLVSNSNPRIVCPRAAHSSLDSSHGTHASRLTPHRTLDARAGARATIYLLVRLRILFACGCA